MCLFHVILLSLSFFELIFDYLGGVALNLTVRRCFIVQLIAIDMIILITIIAIIILIITITLIIITTIISSLSSSSLLLDHYLYLYYHHHHHRWRLVYS